MPAQGLDEKLALMFVHLATGIKKLIYIKSFHIIRDFKPMQI